MKNKKASGIEPLTTQFRGGHDTSSFSASYQDLRPKFYNMDHRGLDKGGHSRDEEKCGGLDEAGRNQREDDDGGPEDGRRREADAVAQQRDEHGWNESSIDKKPEGYSAVDKLLVCHARCRGLNPDKTNYF